MPHSSSTLALLPSAVTVSPSKSSSSSSKASSRMSIAVTFQPDLESALANAEPKTPQPTTMAFLFLTPVISASLDETLPWRLQSIGAWV